MGVDLLAHPRVIQYSSIPHNSTADACWCAAVVVGQEELLVAIRGQQGHDLLHHCEGNTVKSQHQASWGWTLCPLVSTVWTLLFVMRSISPDAFVREIQQTSSYSE